MSEELLRALIQLFAFASNDYDVTYESRRVVEFFLRSELNENLVDKYLKLYDRYLKIFVTHPGQPEQTLNPENVRNVCDSINKSLVQKQKVILLVRLLEYIFVDGNISEHEYKFLTLLSEIFKIPDQEFTNAFDFIKNARGECPSNDKLLEVSGKPTLVSVKNKTLYVEHLENEISVLRFDSVGLYIFLSKGEQHLTLNGRVILNYRGYVLNPGSAIRGPKIDPIFYSDIHSVYSTEKADVPILFEASDLAYRFRNGTMGIQNINFQSREGHLIGIMGGSGSGKSTLLRTLTGEFIPTEGSVRINGIDIHQPNSGIEGVIGYVTQDDALIEELTVFDNLFFNAKLCFDDLDKAELSEKVSSLLSSLGLSEIADLKVGSPNEKIISGGQRKRLNIALELIREPAVLFLDEPTSGLSSRDSENIMDMLKELTHRNKLVFTVIHQPSSEIFKLFDRLMILDQGGYSIYYGEPLESIVYFKEQANQVDSSKTECPECGNVNPEQVLNIVEQKIVDEYGHPTNLRQVEPKDWYDRFQKMVVGVPNVSANDFDKVPKSNLRTPNPFRQFMIFLQRDFLSKMSNKQYVFINLTEAPLLAFILSFFLRKGKTTQDGTMAYSFFDNDNVPIFMFIAIVVSIFVGLTVSAEEIIKDRKLRSREQILNLSRSSYLFSKIGILMAISAIQTALFVIIGNSILEFPGLTAKFWLVFFSLSVFANLLGLNISSSFNSAVTVYILIPFLIIPQMIFSGVLIRFDHLNPQITPRYHVPLIGDLMASRWGFEALAVTQFRDNQVEEATYDINKEISALNYVKVYWIPEIESVVNTLKLCISCTRTETKYEESASLLVSELQNHDPLAGFDLFPNRDRMNAKNLDLDILEDINNYLEDYRIKLNTEYLKRMADRDGIINKLNSTYASEGGFNGLKILETNKALSDLVLNRKQINKIERYKNKLIQKVDPIYHDPMGFRAHFYAPKKLFFGSYLDTFWFNLFSIWMMTVSLVISLRYDLLKKFIDLFDRTRI
ncbi:MAG TPA: ABC transporter [Flavobacteriales bacterium]|jgi:ABC-type multidrug transport system ATPase subunit|nr:ABC transporter [Flavobacteriales bacterium]